jgi:chemotaxis protein MotB
MRTRQGSRPTVDIWPGFVDALSTLLLAVIFMLVVFVLGQFFLSQLLRSRDEAMVRLETTVRDLRSELQLEQDTGADLRRSLGQLSSDLQLALADRDELTGAVAGRDQAISGLEQRLAAADARQAATERERETAAAEREAAEAAAANLRAELEQARQMITADRGQIEVQLADLVRLRRDIEALAAVRRELEGRVAALAAAEQTSHEERQRLLEQLGAARDRSQALEAELADASERTMLAQRDVESSRSRVEELVAQLGLSEGERRSAAEAGEAAAAEAARLLERVRELSQQVSALSQALSFREQTVESQETQIADLGRQLTSALASQVEELSRYRSDFFGKLRAVLGDREDVRIVGDRFVFQSEVLFGSGEADIGANGREQLAKLAAAFKEMVANLPDDLPWVLQVDGHTDRRPISTPRFPSNWELSTARAISVARFLIEQGIPAERVAARGFAQFQPLEEGDSEEALRRNRRIELKLTTR